MRLKHRGLPGWVWSYLKTTQPLWNMLDEPKTYYDELLEREERVRQRLTAIYVKREEPQPGEIGALMESVREYQQQRRNYLKTRK